MFVRLCLALCLLLAAASARAGDLPLGNFGSKDGTSTLAISQGKNGQTAFEITAVNSYNGHLCDMTGTIQGMVGRPDDNGTGAACKVVFSRTGSGIRVELDGDGCDGAYCGVDATFGGGFTALVPPPECAEKPYHAAHDAFLRAYRAKQYGEARDLVTHLLATCGPTDDNDAIDDLDNDLAITLHHLGDDAGCRAALKGLAADAAKSDEALAEEAGPAVDWSESPYRRIIHAARANLRLCHGL